MVQLILEHPVLDGQVSMLFFHMSNLMCDHIRELGFVVEQSYQSSGYIHGSGRERFGAGDWIKQQLEGINVGRIFGHQPLANVIEVAL